MKIDTYRSAVRPSYRLIVPAGTDPASLPGAAAAAVTKLSPLLPLKKGATLSDNFKGELLAFLRQQISSSGAGLVKTEVSFDEV